MMYRVERYELLMTPGLMEIKMSEGADLLHIEVQNLRPPVQNVRPMLWARVSLNARPVGRLLRMVYTGLEWGTDDMPDEPWVGTFTLYDLDYHVFDMGEGKLT